MVKYWLLLQQELRQELCWVFSPGKGSETRKKLNKKAQKIADEVKEKFNGLKEELEKKVKEAGEELA